MEHQTWWCSWIFREGCPVCKAKQVRNYLGLEGIDRAWVIKEVENDLRYTVEEVKWILKTVGLKR